MRLRAAISSGVRSPSRSSRSWTPSTDRRVVLRVELLQLPLDFGERVGVEQLAQLRFAEQLAQLRLIDGQRLRAAFGERRIAVVDVVGDVAEQQRRRERRRHASSRR